MQNASEHKLNECGRKQVFRCSGLFSFYRHGNWCWKCGSLEVTVHGFDLNPFWHGQLWHCQRCCSVRYWRNMKIECLFKAPSHQLLLGVSGTSCTSVCAFHPLHHPAPWWLETTAILAFARGRYLDNVSFAGSVTSAPTQKPRFLWTTFLMTTWNSEHTANTHKLCTRVWACVPFAPRNRKSSEWHSLSATVTKEILSLHPNLHHNDWSMLMLLFRFAQDKNIYVNTSCPWLSQLFFF